MTQQQAIAAAVTMLSETYRQPLTDGAARGYLLALEDLSIEEVGMVTKRALRDSKFMPSPSELLAFAGKAGPQVLAAEIAEAWTAARWARRVHSYTTGVDFGPLVNAVIRSMGGWLVFCGHNDEALESWERKKFETTYAAFRARGEQGALGEALPGMFTGTKRVAIGGRAAPVRQLEAAPLAVASVIRELADQKSQP